jgi:hypothetical protein
MPRALLLIVRCAVDCNFNGPVSGLKSRGVPFGKPPARCARAQALLSDLTSDGNGTVRK